MGFITIRNGSGREVYCCEIGGDGCRRYPCTAHKCPFGWCQRYYICRNCWSKPEIKAEFNAKAHKKKGCKINNAEYEAQRAEEARLRAEGRYIRVSALDQGEALGVQVIFTRGEGEAIGRYMPKEVYNAIKLGVIATPADYQEEERKLGLAGTIREAPASFYHTGTASKEIIS